jgi:putative DNA primase/helicase
MPLLISKAEAIGGIALLVIDPVVSAVQGDSHKNAEVRRGLQRVVDFAEKAGCAVIGITHLSKGTQGQDPVDRIAGSLAFAAAARVCFLAAREKDNGEVPGSGRRVITRIKSNIGPDGGGFYYGIKQTLLHDRIVTSKIEWLGVAEGSAADSIGQAEETNDPETKSALDEAVEFLRETLAQEALPAKEVIKAAKDIGISERTLNRAKQQVGVKAFRKTITGGKHHWMWWIPNRTKDGKSPSDTQDCQDCQDCQNLNSGNLNHAGNLEAKGCQGVQRQKIGNLGNVGEVGGQEQSVNPGRPDFLDAVRQYPAYRKAGRGCSLGNGCPQQKARDRLTS